MANNCKHLIEYSQQVPMPFGSGSVSEPLWDCRIESESEECDENCKDYEELKQITKPEPTAIKRLTYSSRILHLLHKSWPKNEIKLVKAHYTVDGVKAVIKAKIDGRNYSLEIKPE